LTLFQGLNFGDGTGYVNTAAEEVGNPKKASTQLKAPPGLGTQFQKEIAGNAIAGNFLDQNTFRNLANESRPYDGACGGGSELWANARLN